jgi:N-acetylglutamate synthase-like GNAT family acetyltransferase
MQFTDVTKRLREKPIQDVFALAVGYPTPEKLAGLAAQYESMPTWSAFALFEGAAPLGVIGLEQRSPGCAQIRHISVVPDIQRSGIGRRLIEESRTRNGLRELYAETHSDAVPFYQRCGFVVTSLGELHPGVERFACWWRAA